MVVCRGAEDVVCLVLRHHHVRLSGARGSPTMAAAIAVEVDRRHRFRAAVGCRRDRRKDVAQQQHGYLVHRVLAEDITDNPAAVAAQIREVVRSRLRSGRHHGSSA
jgi:hypothetical protein